MATTATNRRHWREPLVQRLLERSREQNPEIVVERYANKLRRDAGQDSLPIRPDQIASIKGIRLRRAKGHPFAGRIYVEEDGQLVMDVNASDTPARQNFTQAHELIHTAFPNFKEEKRYRSETIEMERHPPNREEEYLCDYGAAALLMPAELVEGKYSVRNGLRDAERLAADARVSIEAAANRLVSLADEPAILLCMVWMHKPADRSALRRGDDIPRRLRVRYAFSRHLDIFLPRYKGCDEGSVYERASRSHRSAPVEDVAHLPGLPQAGLFRLQAKRYGAGDLERVLVIGRPTA
ncbi:MAG TPA: ImmA/IrrE family metallo-endopeptidase [Thermoleophilaceae bacterium]|jgi:Zn-dependent peptidase ImmA (M78 family)